MIFFDLKNVAVQNGKTFTEIHDETGISRNTLSSLKNGKSQGIQFDTLDKICKSLNCSISELIKLVPDDYVVTMTKKKHVEDDRVVLFGEVYTAEIEKKLFTDDVMVNMSENFMPISLEFLKNAINNPNQPIIISGNIPVVSKYNEYIDSSDYLPLQEIVKITDNLSDEQKKQICKQLAFIFLNSPYFKVNNSSIVVTLSVTNDVSSYTFDVATLISNK